MENKFVSKGELYSKINFNQAQPISDILYEFLKNAILDGHFPLGERINESKLSTRLAISRTPIRKALAKLTKSGLTEYIPGKGTIVKSISQSKIKEIFSIRIQLEQMLYTNCLELITKPDIFQLTLLARQMLYFYDQNRIDDLIEVFCQFNHQIHEIGHLTTVEELLKHLDTYFINFRNYSLNTMRRRQIATYEHLFIISCLETHDLDQLLFAVRHHITNSEIAALEHFAYVVQPKQTFDNQKLYCNQEGCLIKQLFLNNLRHFTNGKQFITQCSSIELFDTTPLNPDSIRCPD